MTTWTLRLPYSPPLSLNRPMHWSEKARITAQLRADAARLLLGTVTHTERAAWPLDHVEVGLTWNVGTRHRRDADNVVATLKPLADGLITVGLVADDDPAHMTKTMPVIRYTRDPMDLAYPLVLTITRPGS